LARCSFMNLASSCSSSCDSAYIFPGRVDGAPGLSSIAWSHMRDSGKCCAASSLNTLWWCLYSAGMGSRFGLSCSSASVEEVVCHAMRGSTWILPMYRISSSVELGRSRMLGLNWAFSALVLRIIRGSCAMSIHPCAQSILGWFAANKG